MQIVDRMISLEELDRAIAEVEHDDQQLFGYTNGTDALRDLRARIGIPHPSERRTDGELHD